VGVDLDAPRGANLVAVLTASALTAGAVCLVFLTLLRFASRASSFFVAVGIGLGTNFWAVHSQTLAQHDVVAFGLALTLYAWTRPVAELTGGRLAIGALGLALAVTARIQVAPLIAVLGAGLVARVGWRRGLGALVLTALALGALIVCQWHWFGHPLGALLTIESLHPTVHGVSRSLSHEPWIGGAGLLISPNRGLFVFSPVVLIALVGIPAALRRLPRHGIEASLAACLAQYLGYASYSVWWGGHSYGPRYLLDFLVLLTPPAAIALDHVVRVSWARGLAAIALVWSMTAAGTGAFFADDWSTSPSVDQHHQRLWDWHDLQITRAWRNGLSRQNFNLFNTTSIRREPESPP
jgi:hypothetical protein